MKCCSNCGSPIPDNQGSICSMCYGDISHGNDSFYQDQAYMEDQEYKKMEQREEENEQRSFIVDVVKSKAVDPFNDREMQEAKEAIKKQDSK